MSTWTAEEIYDILVSGNSVTDVAEHLRQAECDRLNAEMAPYNEARRIEAQAEIDRKVAAHEPLSEEEIEDFFQTGLPHGYFRRDWMSGFWDWKGFD